MAITVVRNTATGDEPVLAPTKDSGDGYRYCMYFNGDVDVAFADSILELLDTLIPGYATLSEEDQDVARIQFSQTAAATVQAAIMAELEPGDVTDEEYKILGAPRQLAQPTVTFWTSQVPLIAVETSYAPYTDVPRPASGTSATEEDSNIWWIRPMDEEEFLVSLHEIGVIRLMENTQIAAE